MKNTFYYNTKIGEIAIEENGLAITRLYFVNKDLEKEVKRLGRIIFYERKDKDN